MITSITTINFKKLKDNHFEFSDGLNVITGENAQGKTTLLYALSFALFGTRSVPSQAKHIPTWGEKDCMVVLTTESLVVERSLNNCKVTSTSGELLATGTTDCNQYIIEKVTGLDYKDLRTLNWSAQGETSAILTIGATQLQRDVERLSGVDFIDNVIRLLNSDISDNLKQLDGFEPSKLAELGKWISEFENSKLIRSDLAEKGKVRLEALNTEYAELETKLDTGRKANKKREASLAEVSRLSDRKNRLLGEIQQLQHVIGVATAQIGTLPVGDTPKLNSLIHELEDKSLAEGELQYHNLRADQLTKLLTDSVKGILLDEALTRARDEANQDLAEKRKDLVVSESKIDGINSELTKVTKAIDSGICDACGTILADEAALRSHKEAEEELGVELLEAIEVKTLLSIAYQRANTENGAAFAAFKDGYIGWELKASEAEASQEEIAVALISIRKRLLGTDVEYLKDTIDTIKSQRTVRRESEERLSDTSAELAKKERLLDRLEASFKALNIPEEIDITGMSSELIRLVEARSEETMRCAKATSEIAEMSDKLKGWKAEKAIQTTLSGLFSSNALLVDLQAYLKTSRSRFISGVWAEILGAASGMVNTSTRGRISEISRSVKGDFMFKEDGIHCPISAASGAQRGFIGVAMRLALTQALRASFPIVILDEPTESMSEDNARNLSGSLFGRGQILMVTHRVSDQLSAANVIQL